MTQTDMFSTSYGLNSEERRVYEGVLGRPTPEDAIGMRDLAERCGMSERDLRDTVLHLRFAHNIPIASSSRAGGYWLPGGPACAAPHVDEFSQRAFTAALNLAVIRRERLTDTLEWLYRKVADGEKIRGLLPADVCGELVGSEAI